MNEFHWTDAQQDAIQARGEILVSAAAGSGKTAVLVERVMRMIESECNIDELLIVTFTRAAAAQMKEKIASAITERVEKDPENKHFRLQQILLEKAQITTIDAFCADVVKNNYQQLKDIDISFNYQNLDSAQFAVLSREVLDEVLDSFYDSGEPAFRELMDVFTSGKNDLNIYSVIDLLHTYTSAFANRSQWMREKIDYYRQDRIGDSIWGKLLLQAATEYLLLALDYIQIAIDAVAPDENTDAVYGAVFRADKAIIQAAADAAMRGDWDALYAMKQTAFARFPSVKKNIDETLKDAARPFRKEAQSAFWAALGFIVESQAQFLEDNRAVYPVADELKRLFEAYEEALFARKAERLEFEFSDIAALALKILTDENGNPTETALEYQRKFKGILVDEYQDTNGVQDLIFNTVSNRNLFVVGDVKQSIYRFRQAMPWIFIDRKKSLAPYQSGADSGYILLKNNFRSEKPITDFVNFLFKKIMSESLGDVAYNEDEYLIPGSNSKDDGAAPVELHILDDVHLPDRKKVKKHEYEAHYIARLIQDAVTSGQELKIGDTVRATGYADYCVLVRSRTHMKELESAFADCGVPCAAVAGEKLFDTPEIMLVMSFLRAIDNPLCDVDLIAVMYSELFGFTAQQLAAIRIAGRGGSFYEAVCAAASQGNRQCADFLKELTDYRNAAAVNAPAEFIRLMYEKSALPDICAAGADGATKRANLNKFISIVKLYSDAGYYGLTGLVRFLDKVKQNNPDISTAYIPSGESKVSIMTVHASKGLEFPVVIFAFTNQSNNHYGSSIVLNREYGIGIKPKNMQDNARYETVAYSAVALANLRDDIAEELRTLYVALTRAKGKLIITGTYDGAVKASGMSPREDKVALIATLTAQTAALREGWLRRNNNYLSWLIACALKHPQAAALRKLAAVSDTAVDTHETGAFRVVLPVFYPTPASAQEPEYHAQPDAALAQKVRENFAFEYAYAGSESIESKKTPSAVAESESGLKYAFAVPAFMPSGQKSAANRGTATHRFMEKVRSFADFDYGRELAVMLEKGFLSEGEAAVIDKDAVCRFFDSALAQRMAKAQRLEKEYAVAYLENAGFFDPSLREELQHEKVFVDGMIDAVFMEGDKAVIVDYKTDRVDSEQELLDRYRRQLELYARAIERIWGVEVMQCHIYSFALGADICVDF